MERVILISDYYQRKNNNHIFYDKNVTTNNDCNLPWNTLIINRYGDSYICISPAWLPKSIGSITEVDNIYDLLNSYEARMIREEILKKRYFYCNSNLCAFFSKADKSKFTQSPPINGKELDPLSGLSIDSLVNEQPKKLIFDFDYTCNFVCPSCRTELINNNKDSFLTVNDLIVEKIKNLLLNKIEKRTEIRWAGGEPFISRSYLNLWEHIISLKNTNIRNIIQTNGSYLKKKEKILLSFLPYVDSFRISFDAGTKDTYSKIRVNGNWKTLIDNCKWLRKVIDTHKSETLLCADFVVQMDNYLEINEFVKITKELGFDRINLTKMWNWGTWTDLEFSARNVSDKSHPSYNNFLNVIRNPNILNDDTIAKFAWKQDL